MMIFHIVYILLMESDWLDYLESPYLAFVFSSHFEYFLLYKNNITISTNSVFHINILNE